MQINASKHAKHNYANPVVPAAQLVNRVGKYLYKHLDGAYKIEKEPNICDVYTVVLYSIPTKIVKEYNIDDAYLDVNELHIDISITTYQNKIRVNLIEVSPYERTIGFDVFKPEDLQEMQEAYNLIYNKIVKRITKEFEGFEFIF